MIVGMIIKLLVLIVDLITFMLPSWTLPEEIIDNFYLLWSTLAGLNGILPLQELWTVIYLSILFELAIIGFRLIMGIVATLRGSGKIDV